MSIPTNDQKRDLRMKKLALFFSRNSLWEKLYAVENAVWGKTGAFRISVLVAASTGDARQHDFHSVLKSLKDAGTSPPKPVHPKTLPDPGPQTYHVGLSSKWIREWSRLKSPFRPTSDQAALQHLHWAIGLLSTALRESTGTPGVKDHIRTLSRLQQQVLDCEKALVRHDFSLIKMMDLIGMKYVDGYKILDHAFLRKAPLLNLGWYRDDKQRAAKSDLDHIGGLFKVWLKREAANGKLTVLQCMLQVRFVLDIETNLSVLRAKLRVPRIGIDGRSAAAAKSSDAGPGHWTYDGIARKLGDRCTLMFEQRSVADQDFFFIIMSDAQQTHKECSLFVGNYLTSGSEPPWPPIADVVIMKRIEPVARTNDEVKRQSGLIKSEVRVLGTNRERSEFEACLRLLNAPPS